MLKSMLTAVAVVAFAAPVVAQAPATQAAPAQSAAAQPAAGKSASAKPAAPRVRRQAGGAMMARHTTKAGKTITYNCAKAGNKNKTACKGK